MLYHKQLLDSSNCFQVCVACLLGVPVEEISDHLNGREDKWDLERGRLQLFHKYGVYLVDVDYTKPCLYASPVPVPCIAIGPSPRDENIHHAVVGELHHSVNFVHDPHPDDTFIKKVDTVTLLVPRIKL